MKRLFILTLLILPVVLASCKQADSRMYNGADAQEIFIGVAYPVGANNEITYYREGLELALEQVNERGGVLGKPLRFLIRDDGNDENTALQIAQGFSDLGITAVIGHWSSNICYVTEDTYEENQVVLLMPCATSTSLFEQDYQYIFRICSNSDAYARAIADEISRQKCASIAICYSDDVYGRDFALHVEKALSAQNILVADRITGLSQANAERIEARWRAFGCDGVVMGNTMPENVALIKRIRGMDRQYPIFGADNFQRTTFLAGLGADAQGLYTVAHPPESMDQTFLSLFEARYGHAPDLFAISGYEAVRLLCDAMEATGTTDSAAIAQYLSTLKDYPSAAGVLTYNPATHEFDGHQISAFPVLN